MQRRAEKLNDDDAFVTTLLYYFYQLYNIKLAGWIENPYIIANVLSISVLR